MERRGGVRIIFDLDGTLVDSAPDLRRAANLMLASLGRAPITLAETVSFVGNGLPKLAERALLARGVAEADHAPLIEMMRATYEAETVVETRVYPGVMDALETLLDAGHRLGICTNKPETPARALLDTLDLARFFDVVIGGDTLPVKKPDPAPLLQSFVVLGEGAQLYVGDSEVDAETAVRAGVDFALFTEGYRKSPVEELPHRVRFSDFAELSTMLLTDPA